MKKTILFCLLGLGTSAFAQNGTGPLCSEQAQQELTSCMNEEEKGGGGLCMEQYEARLEICQRLGEDPYAPEISPENFVDPAQIGDTVEPNTYFPLVEGRSWTYEGPEGERVEVEVTNETKEILGVTARVVRDTETEDDEVVEDTKDWFAQDQEGNVWYFGEFSQEFEDGEPVGTAGSWEAGVDGAQPGIIMKAVPSVGDFYRQEFLLGEAEDMGEVLSVSASATTPAASCDGDCLQTRDWTPLEPDVEENKFYAPGIGLILEVDTESGERVELIEYQQ